MREELITRKKSGSNGRGVREEMSMVGEGSCEKDLRLVGREFQRRGEELRKERSENLSLEVWAEVSDRGATFTCEFDVNEITR